MSGIGLSVNHVAMGGARMELTAGQTSQSCACALMIAEEQGIDVQDVDYAHSPRPHPGNANAD